MPSASPFLEQGGLCFLKTETSWDCEDYSVYEEFGLYSANVVTSGSNLSHAQSNITPTLMNRNNLTQEENELALLLPSDTHDTKTIPLFAEMGGHHHQQHHHLHPQEDGSNWKKKPVCNWEVSETAQWFLDVAKRYQLSVDALHAGAFINLKGTQLLQMTLSEFLTRDPLQGRHFYTALQQMLDNNHLQQQQHRQQQQHESTIDENVSDLLGLTQGDSQQHQQASSFTSLISCDGYSDSRQLHHGLVSSPQLGHVLQYCLQNNNTDMVPSTNEWMDHSMSQRIERQSCNEANEVSIYQNDGPVDIDPAEFGLDGDWHQESISGGTPSDDSEENFNIPETNSSKKVGRPKGKVGSRRKTEKGFGRLWEFIRDLLHDPRYCPSMVRWENVDEGIFRIVKSEQLAALWGNIKNNPRMTYEKLSRAMRYYYKSRVFLPVLGRRLVYKFGPNAVHWRPEDPNFERKNACEAN